MKKKKLFAILLLVAVCAGCGAEKEQTTMVTVDIALSLIHISEPTRPY